MARLYANENFPLPVVEQLRRFGHDALTVQESAQAGRRMTDEEVLRFATKQARAVLTLNRRHFVRLHAEGPQHAGIIVCSFDPDFVDRAGRIHAAISGRQELTGQLLRVPRPER